MMLISDQYRQQQKALHDKYEEYGSASLMYAPIVGRLANAYKVGELLDYGAGKLRLWESINAKKLIDHPIRYSAYEPSDERFSERPEPMEMVACIDVLEHIEPDLLENVLDDLERVTKRIGVYSITTVEAVKTLPDGRNAHLIVEPMEWWLPKILQRWELHFLQRVQDGFYVVVQNPNYVPSEIENVTNH